MSTTCSQSCSDQGCACAAAGGVEALDTAAIDAIIQRIGSHEYNTIQLLQAVQARFQYLPQPALEYLSLKTGITPSAIMSAATFYRQFRHTPVGKHRIKVCIGTACHVKGATLVIDTVKQVLGIPSHGDTDTDRKFTVEGVACLGCCTLAPVVQIDHLTYGHIRPADVSPMIKDFERMLALHGAGGPPDPLEAPAGSPEIRVGMGSCCMVKGSDAILKNISEAVERTGAEVAVRRVGCVGQCYQTPLVEVVIPGQKPTIYVRVRPEDAEGIVRKHFPHHVVSRALSFMDRLLGAAVSGQDDAANIESYYLNPRDTATADFVGPQIRLATHGFGFMDPLSYNEYVEHGGFRGLRKAYTELGPEKIIEEMLASGLRGRGGAGFPTGQKWKICRAQPGDHKYVVCNGDEGDPGAFMDRMLLESFPYRVIEGLAICAFAVGAHEGYLYIRAEYPLAIERVRAALAVCEEKGLLGDSVLGTGYSLRLKIKEGAGAFVCGEETALIESIEGRRGFPRVRPPFPAQAGLWGKPTNVNNVETLAMIPWIIREGSGKFAAMGTETSKGTKVFALAGKVLRGGLIEVQMGATIRQVVMEIGGGVAPGRRFKAVQIGGPSGGCIPERLADTSIDYNELIKIGAMMGSGGLVVLDDRDCMVDMARYFLSFTQEEACGQCSIGRIGTRRMLDILERLCAGEGKKTDIADLEELAGLIKASALCQLCKTAPNPVLTTLKYFRDEYEAHLRGECPAGRCTKMIRYSVNERCTGCTLCAQACPVKAIPITPYRQHAIDASICTRCDACRPACPVDAIDIVTGNENKLTAASKRK